MFLLNGDWPTVGGVGSLVDFLDPLVGVDYYSISHMLVFGDLDTSNARNQSKVSWDILRLKNDKEEYLSAKYQLIWLKLSFCSPKMWKLIHLWETTKIANGIDRSCRVGSIPGKITTCLPLPSTRVRPLALSARDFRRFFCFIFGRWLAFRDLVCVWCVFFMLQSLPSGSLT